MAHTIYGLWRDGSCVYIGRTGQRLATRTKPAYYRFNFDEVRVMATTKAKDRARYLEWVMIQGLKPVENIVTGYRPPKPNWEDTPARDKRGDVDDSPLTDFEIGLAIWDLSVPF